MTRELKSLAAGFSFHEAPRWHGGRLWVVDLYQRRVYSLAEDGSDRRVEFEVPDQPVSIGWLPDGRPLVVASE